MHFDSKQNGYDTLFTGLNAEVPLLNGERRRFTNLDNAASTPPLKAVQKAVNDFMIYYSSVHRGTGYKSQLSTHVYEMARKTVLKFVGADPETHICIFGKNTTEAINKLARRFPFSDKRNIVITSGMEHHSNDLPWRAAANVVHVKLTQDGRLDESDFDQILKQYSNRVALVAISGASNVTGIINPIHRLAEKSHKVGAKIAVDCAQLAPHRKVDMLPIDNPAHIDYLAISAHKLYAPFGTGALIGLKETFENGSPDISGGGTVEFVTLDEVTWSAPPERDEAGSPNTIGAVALAAAIRQLEQIGMQVIADHEAHITSKTLEKLLKIPGIEIFGNANPDQAFERLGVIPFNLDQISHFLLAAILGYEYGIGVRNGCFCAHPYILHILGLSPNEALIVRDQMLAGNKSEMPGLIRVSFGLYNTIEDIEILIEALNHIKNGRYKGKYVQNRASGEYTPEDWKPDFERYFSLTSIIDRYSL
jgi:selenocysteine lyase/cysteine desulfurase